MVGEDRELHRREHDVRGMSGRLDPVCLSLRKGHRAGQLHHLQTAQRLREEGGSGLLL